MNTVLLLAIGGCIGAAVVLVGTWLLQWKAAGPPV